MQDEEFWADMLCEAGLYEHRGRTRTTPVWLSIISDRIISEGIISAEARKLSRGITQPALYIDLFPYGSKGIMIATTACTACQLGDASEPL
jgi:hypothetical protein